MISRCPRIERPKVSPRATLATQAASTQAKRYSILFQSKELHLIGPTVEMSEYHWFHREKVELFMAELYNKVGE